MGGRSSSFKHSGGSTAPTKKLSNDEIAERLTKEGFNRWNKYGKDRMYYNPYDSGDIKKFYKGNGRLDHAEVANGDWLYPSDERRFSFNVTGDRTYFDLNDRKLHGTNDTIMDLALRHIKKEYR